MEFSQQRNKWHRQCPSLTLCTEGTARLLWPGAELILVSCLGIAVGRSEMLVHAREGGSPLGAVPEGRELRWDLPVPRTEQEASCLGSRQSGVSS